MKPQFCPISVDRAIEIICRAPSTDYVIVIDASNTERRGEVMLDEIRKIVPTGAALFSDGSVGFIVRSEDMREERCFECDSVIEPGDLWFGCGRMICSSCYLKERKTVAARSSARRRISELRCWGFHTEDQWQALLQFCFGLCLRCQSKYNISRDHVRPLYRGGTNWISNIQPLCRRCNSWKATRIIDFRETRCKEFVETLQKGNDQFPNRVTGGKKS